MGITVSDVAMGQVFQQVFGLPLSMPFHLTCIYPSTTDPMQSTTLASLLNKHKTWIEWEEYVAYTEKANIFTATLKWSCAWWFTSLDGPVNFRIKIICSISG